MDWKKAKNYTIIFLLLLNLLLFALNIIKYNKYNLSQSQEKSITAILDKGNIVLECDIPEKFRPMPQMSLKSASYDALELQNIFFQNTANVKRTEEFEKTIFSFENENLTIYSNYAFYENKNKEQGFRLDKKNAVNKVNGYFSAIEKKFGALSLTHSINGEDYVILVYDSSFLENPIFNNTVTFKVYSNGSFSCDFSYFEPIQMVGEKTEICSADEALFSFYKGIKNVYSPDENGKIKIVKIDLGYFSEDYLDMDTEITAVPHYRVFIDGVDTPYFINAYNGSMVYQ